MPHNTKYFTAADGTRLAYFDKYVAGSNIGVIIVHGLAEHKGRYDEFMDKLAAGGISAFAIDLRGHGNSGGRRCDIDKFDTYLSDLDGFVRFIKKSYPELKLALFGHSIGGMISTVYVANNGHIDLLVLSSPAFETPRGIRLLNIFPTCMLGKIYIKKRVSESAASLAYNRRDPLACRHFSLRVLKNVFIHGVKRAGRGFARVNIPVLMLGGRGDIMVDSNKLQPFLDKFASPDKTMIMYENAKHRIVQNESAEKSIPDIIEWLKERV